MYIYYVIFCTTVKAPQNKNPITNVIKTHGGGT